MNTNKKVSPRQKAKDPFSITEDSIIKQFVESYGSGDFGMIKYYLPNRTARQVRERWRLYLNPEIDNSQFSEEEDQLLIEKYSECKGSWSQIRQYFKGRTDVKLKYRFQQLDRKGLFPKKRSDVKETYSNIEMINVLLSSNGNNEFDGLIDDSFGYINLFDEIDSIGNHFGIYHTENRNSEQTNEVQNVFF
jgi:hypothetical protein